MNEVLQEAFRFSAWATKTLIAVCRGLSPEQLERPAPGYGSILATLNHLIRSDAGYVTSLTGDRPPWVNEEGESDDLYSLETRADETLRLWEELLKEPFDGERLLLLDNGAYECHASIVIAQALHHGNAHREQVCASLTAFNFEPPDVQPWAYADATGRARWLGTRSD